MVCEWLYVEEGAVVGKAGRRDGACNQRRMRPGWEAATFRREWRGRAAASCSSPHWGEQLGGVFLQQLHLSVQQLHPSLQTFFAANTAWGAQPGLGAARWGVSGHWESVPAAGIGS